MFDGTKMIIFPLFVVVDDPIRKWCFVGRFGVDDHRGGQWVFDEEFDIISFF